MLGAATFQSCADIQNYQAIVPIGEISQTVLHIEIVQVTANYLFAFLGTNRGSRWILSLPAGDFLRVLYVTKIDYTHRSRRVIGQVNVVTVDKRAVHAAGNRRGVFRDQFWMRRI